jgi:UDP-N-acetylmuramyl tripeptide synthase
MKRLETLLYVGPNRRSEKPGIEHVLALPNAEATAVAAQRLALPAALASMLRDAGVDSAARDYLSPDQGASEIAAVGHMFVSTVILLQQATGHDVSERRLIPGDLPHEIRTWYEYEHSEVGRRAATLALKFIARLLPELQFEEDPADQGESELELFNEFAAYAVQQVLPRDTQAILDACSRLDIPCIKLDRDPYEGLSGEFRIREHGLLKLGHSCYQQIVDGTLCISRSDPQSALLHDRDVIFKTLTQLDLPVAAQDSEFRNCTNPGRAARSAERIGYPVVIKPTLRGRGGITLNVPDAAALPAAVHAAQAFGRRVIVERFVSGGTFKLIVAGGSLVGVVAMDDAADVTALAHSDYRQIAARTADAMEFGLLVITVATPDISQSLAQSGGKIVDLEVAPELDTFLPAGSALLDLAAEQFVRWIFPEATKSRVPVISIGGTNGKTTTSRMVASMMQAAGHRVGMALSDGVYINGELTEAGDLAGVPGHLRVFESMEVDCAVLETAMGSLTHSGIVFDWCNAALCTNVSVDHLGNMGVNTLEQLAEVKRFALERARDTVVLNADDKYCLSMLPYMTARTICLTSMKLDIGQMRERFPDIDHFCVLERADGVEWIVLHDAGGKIQVIDSNDIPAGFNGHARFNINNAMHAVAICHYSGVGLEQVRMALGSFAMSYENAPGRQNIYDDFPFPVMVDYAHNEAGIRSLSELAGSLEVEGRKIICYSVEETRSEQEIGQLAATAAGHFDLYICKRYQQSRNYAYSYNREVQDVPQFMKNGLLANGIAAEQIFPIEDEQEAIRQALNMARPGDFVVIQVGNAAKVTIHEVLMKYSKEFAADSGCRTATDR